MKSLIIIVISTLFILVNFITNINSTLNIDLDCRNLVNNIESGRDSIGYNSYGSEVILNLRNRECKDYHITAIINKYIKQKGINNTISIVGNTTYGTTIIQSEKVSFLNLIDNNNSNNNSSNNEDSTTTLTINVSNINFKDWITPIVTIKPTTGIITTTTTINNKINFFNTTFNNQTNSDIIISTTPNNSITIDNCKFENIQVQRHHIPIYLIQTSLLITSTTFNNINSNYSFIHINASNLSITNSTSNNITTQSQSFITLINSPIITITNYNHSNSQGSFISFNSSIDQFPDIINHQMLITIEYCNFINNTILPILVVDQRDNGKDNGITTVLSKDIKTNNTNGFLVFYGSEQQQKQKQQYSSQVLFNENTFSNISSPKTNNFSLLNILSINLTLENNSIIGCNGGDNVLNENLIYIVSSNLTLINTKIESDNPITGYSSSVYVDSCSNHKIVNGSENSNTTNNGSTSGGNKLKSEWCNQCMGCIFKVSTDDNKILTNSDICPNIDDSGQLIPTSGNKAFKDTVLVVSLIGVCILAIALILVVAIVKRRNKRKSSFDYLLINQYYLDDEEEKKDLLLNRNYNANDFLF